MLERDFNHNWPAAKDSSPCRSSRRNAVSVKWNQKRKSKLLSRISALRVEMTSYQQQIEPVRTPLVRDILKDLVTSVVSESEAKAASKNWLPSFASISLPPELGAPSTKFCHIKKHVKIKTCQWCVYRTPEPVPAPIVGPPKVISSERSLDDYTSEAPSIDAINYRAKHRLSLADASGDSRRKRLRRSLQQLKKEFATLEDNFKPKSGNAAEGSERPSNEAQAVAGSIVEDIFHRSVDSVFRKNRKRRLAGEAHAAKRPRHGTHDSATDTKAIAQHIIGDILFKSVEICFDKNGEEDLGIAGHEAKKKHLQRSDEWPEVEILDDHVELIVIDSDDENEGNADSSDGSLHTRPSLADAMVQTDPQAEDVVDGSVDANSGQKANGSAVQSADATVQTNEEDSGIWTADDTQPMLSLEGVPVVQYDDHTTQTEAPPPPPPDTRERDIQTDEAEPPVARDTKTTQTEITPPDFCNKETQVDYLEIKETSTQTEDVENEPEEEGVLGFLCRNLPEEECSIDNLPARLRKHFEQSPQSIEIFTDNEGRSNGFFASFPHLEADAIITGASAFVTSNAEDLWMMASDNFLDLQACPRDAWLDWEPKDADVTDAVHDLYRRFKTVKSLLLQPGPGQDGEEDLTEALDDLWQFFVNEKAELAGDFKARFETLLAELLATVTTEKLQSLILGSRFLRSLDGIGPAVRLLTARLVDAPMADFGHLVELALRLQNLILADSSREFARFIWEAGQLIQALVDKCARSLHQMQGPNAAKKGGQPNNAQAADDGQKWVIDVSDYLHLKCQTRNQLAKCQMACSALFEFFTHPWKDQPFSFCMPGRSCINRVLNSRVEASGGRPRETFQMRVRVRQETLDKNQMKQAGATAERAGTLISKLDQNEVKPDPGAVNNHLQLERLRQAHTHLAKISRGVRDLIQKLGIAVVPQQ